MSSASYSLAGKVAVVVGGSNGIGKSTVKRLAEAGASVFVSYNSGEDRAKEVIASLPAPQGTDAPKHGVFKLVLEDPASVKAAAETVKAAAGGKVHVLVNSGGFFACRPLEFGLETW